jgi:CHAT domain-containing protein
LEEALHEQKAAIDAIRALLVDGQQPYADFLLAPSFEKIQQAATPDAPLVYLAATPVGGVALVVAAASQKSNFSEKLDFSPPPPVTAIWLDGLAEASLRAAIYGPADDPALGGYLGAYDGWRRNPRNPAARASWHAALDETTRWLWDAAMQPVLAHLAALGAAQAVLLPAGLLGLLPFHAAWSEDASTPTGRRYALDSIAFSYAPGAVAQAEAQARAAAGATDGLLAVDNPDGSLVFSRQEVQAVRSYFPPGQTTVLAGAQATRQAVLDQSTSFPIYHFSTHGWAGWSEPLEGGLLLAGGATLTLADILDLRLQGARLAVLSACETGIPGTKTPDEVVSLSTGLVQAGVAGVVASLWAVNDLSTAMLIERFYRLWREEGQAPAAALRQAQIWLRDSSNQELAAHFEQDILPALQARMPAEVAAHLAFDRLRSDPGTRDFAHPIWWAAFTMTGA